MIVEHSQMQEARNKNNEEKGVTGAFHMGKGGKSVWSWEHSYV